MKRTALLAAIGVGFVFAATLFISKGNARGRKVTESTTARITETTVHGHAEFYGRWMPLAGYQGGSGDYVDWVASASADPKKAEFTISLRKGPPSRDSWEEETKSPVALIVDGRRFNLKARTEVIGKDRMPRSHLNCEGNRSVLAEVAAATSAEIEFGGKRYDLGEQGLANFRELLRQSDAAAKR